jgi:hypothetical protein
MCDSKNEEYVIANLVTLWLRLLVNCDYNYWKHCVCSPPMNMCDRNIATEWFATAAYICLQKTIGWPCWIATRLVCACKKQVKKVHCKQNSRKKLHLLGVIANLVMLWLQLLTTKPYFVLQHPKTCVIAKLFTVRLQPRVRCDCKNSWENSEFATLATSTCRRKKT